MAQNNAPDQSEPGQKEHGLWRQIFLPSLSLFTSLGTLLCCALPALLVTLGMGAVMAGLISTAPWLTALSKHKEIVFGVAFLLLSAATIMQWLARNAPCPADPKKARSCAQLRKASWIILGLSWALLLIGFFFAFFAATVFYG